MLFMLRPPHYHRRLKKMLHNTRRDINRRSFLKKAGSIAGMSITVSAPFSVIPSNVLGAADRMRFALIGCGGRGRYIARGLITLGAELTHLCDLLQERLDESWQFLSEVQSKKPKLVKEMRKVLDAKDVDAVVIATPDHWHGPATILACQAGKDVYVEKPHAHNIWESQKMKESAAKYERIIQVGTQNRSGDYIKAALDYVNSGKLGKIGLVKVYNLKPGSAFELGDPGTMPPDFNWDVWLGAAPDRPYHERLFKGGWHKYWDFSGGDLADDGIHQLDLALNVSGNPGFPRAISCSGGRIVYRGDDAEVPDVQIVTYDFEDFVMTLELTNYPRYMQKTSATIRRNDLFPYWTQNATRIELYGSELMMTLGIHGGGWQVTTSGGKVVDQIYGRPPDDDHYQNFIECVRDRKRPAADIAIAHTACSMVHMANIAHRTGNITLKFDPETEKFVDNPEANLMLKRRYRKPYEIPEKV